MWDQLALVDLPTSIDQLDLPDMLDLKDQPDLLAQLDPLVRKHISFYLYKQSFLNYVHVRASVIFKHLYSDQKKSLQLFYLLLRLLAQTGPAHPTGSTGMTCPMGPTGPTEPTESAGAPGSTSATGAAPGKFKKIPCVSQSNYHFF